jgi:hypothetical protein
MLASLKFSRVRLRGAGHRDIVMKHLAGVCPALRNRSFSTEVQDEALAWAQENRVLAQRCLELPPFTDEKTAPDLTLPDNDTLNSFEDYWKWRQWDFSFVNEQKDVTKAQALTTHVLSAPLTLATQLLLPGPSHHQKMRAKKKRRRRMNYCCIGARAESQLPEQYWKELLVIAEASGQTMIDVQLDFVGPEILRRPMARLRHGSSTLTLRWPFNGKLHDYVAAQQEEGALSNWDAFILFNPGIGHENLQKDWKPTVDLLLLDAFQAPRRPLLLTAHSALDAMREANVLCNYLLATAPLYVENPFASCITYQDPFDDRHVVRPNHYVYQIVD